MSRQRSAHARAEARAVRRFVAYLRCRNAETEALWRQAARLRDRLERFW